MLASQFGLASLKVRRLLNRNLLLGNILNAGSLSLRPFAELGTNNGADILGLAIT